MNEGFQTSDSSCELFEIMNSKLLYASLLATFLNDTCEVFATINDTYQIKYIHVSTQNSHFHGTIFNSEDIDL